MCANMIMVKSLYNCKKYYILKVTLKLNDKQVCLTNLFTIEAISHSAFLTWFTHLAKTVCFVLAALLMSF